MSLKILWRVTAQATVGWWQDNCLRLAASLAYYTALSLAPLVVIVVGLAGLVTERQLAASELETQLELLMGPHGRQLVHTIVTATEPEGGRRAAVIGLATLLISATAVFGELQAALNLIWEVKPAATGGLWGDLWFWLKQRLLSLAIVLAIAFLLLVSLVLSAALAGAAAFLRGPEPAPLLLGRLLEMAVSILVITVLFALLFKYVPDAQIRWRDVWLGGAVSAVLFTLGKLAIGYYIGHASVGPPYGAAGSLVALLVWVYYSSLIVFFGAEFTQAWATRQHAVRPLPHAEAGAAPQTKSAAEAEQATQ